MEGTRVYVPDARLVWIPATVTSVECDGKLFHVRVDNPRRTVLDTDCGIDPNEVGGGGFGGHVDGDYFDQSYGEDRIVDLRKDGMPDALPLQNSVAEMVTRHKKKNEQATADAIHVLGTAHMNATTATGAEDMCELHHLHEPAIVYNVRDRFFAQAPYTYTGKIVVAVNPYRWIKPLYTEDLRALYSKYGRDVLPPHVYATSAEAFHNMKHHRMPQSILVSGESGAGKTETVKIMMEHLASISMANATKLKEKHAMSTASGSSVAKTAPGHHSIVEKVLKSNPLLEAFGNAKTIRNDNSSRFGKFTQLHFSSDLCLVGAECRHYLLEKSRVVHQAPGERNYHIFYQLVSAQEPQYGFETRSSAADYRYLQDEELLLDGQTDLERYQITRDALSTIGVAGGEQDDLFRALVGILRLGQLEFVPLESDKNDSSQPVASLDLDSATGDHQELIQEQQREIQKCAEFLGVEVATLGHKMCSRTVRARQEVYSVPLSALQAGNNRDALAKELYSRLFAHLVRRVNKSISGSMYAANTPSYMHIDLLDIFGFESFQRNSFEQFCINFANEKLQQKFTLDVFKTVQEEYTQEQVGWAFIKFKDNQDMLDLLENSMGLMALLNEECVRPMGSDMSFASKIVSLHESHPRLEKIRVSQTQFLLHHYAGPVTYDAEGFVEKNRDSLQSDLLDLLSKSSNSLIAGIFGAQSSSLYSDDDLAAVFAAATSDDSRRSSVAGRKTATFMQETVSYKFKAQLALLMSDISATEVHYVRCIKPNSKKSPHSYEIDEVVNQLRCAGVIEAIRITRAAFPNKMSHEKFLRRFVLMKDGSDAATTVSSSSTAAAACERLVVTLLGNDFTRLDADDQTPLYVVGKTLVYFGKDVLEYLEQRRTVFVHECAIKIQRRTRRWFARKRMVTLRKMIVSLQAIQKCKIARRVFVEKRTQCTKIQSVWRGVRSRQQAAFMLNDRAATRIQASFRSYLARLRYTRFRDAVIKVQAQLKMKKQVDKYQQLLEDKKEHILMESEVAQLKHRLEEEKRARSEIEAVNSSLQQELRVVRQSSLTFSDGDLHAPPPGQSVLATTATRQRSDKDAMLANDVESRLLDDSERMIDYLKKEVTKGRDLIGALTHENENLKLENKKVKDAYAAAGASFAALNQHNKQQSKANLRLMSTHAALIKSQEEKMKKYQKQITDLKEDLKMQRSVYSAELMARVQQQDLLVEMVRLSESFNVPDELLERMRSLIENSKPLYTTNGNTNGKPPLGRHDSGSGGYNRSNRSDTISSIGPVSVAVSQQPTAADLANGVGRTGRRATIDSVLMNPPLPRNLVDNMHSQQGYPNNNTTTNGTADHEYQERSTWVSSGSRASVYYDEDTRGRKSRIGGMFKKMFKKDDKPSGESQ